MIRKSIGVAEPVGRESYRYVDAGLYREVLPPHERITPADIEAARWRLHRRRGEARVLIAGVVAIALAPFIAWLVTL